jgi:Flp pilus assembly CpaE family ATPase
VTTAAVFITAALAMAQRRNVCLTHTDFTSYNINAMFRLPKESDIAKSLSQVVTLLQTNSVNVNDLPCYTEAITETFHYYTTPIQNLTESETVQYFTYLLNQFKKCFAHVIIDSDSSEDAMISREVLRESEIVVIAINHNLDCIEKAIEMKQQIESANQGKRSNKDPDKLVLFCLNQYNSKIESFKNVARRLGVNPKDLITIRSSYFIPKCQNRGSIEDVFNFALNDDPRIPFLKEDMKRICSILERDRVKR